MRVVISQPMFLPWVGIFEQINNADIFVHYDDVQLPRGRSFISRVQIKTNSGTKWLTAPIDRSKSGNLINETLLLEDQKWRYKHMKKLHHNYSKSPFYDMMKSIYKELYSIKSINLAEFNINAIEFISKWFGLGAKFFRSSQLNISGRSTKRLIDICMYFEADEYITGHGAKNYLDHLAFERRGIKVCYMDYNCTPYPQLHGAFTPYVSVLDLIANCGNNAAEYINSGTIYWKEFLNGSDQEI